MPVNRYMFHVRASYADETAAIVNQLVSLSLKKVAVFYQNDGLGLDGVVATLKKHNLAPSAEFVRQMKSRGLYPQFTALSPVGAELPAAELGEGARGIGILQVMPYLWNDTVPVVKEYHRLMEKQQTPHVPSYYGVEGFITAKLLVNALDGMHEHDLGGSHQSHAGQSQWLGFRRFDDD